MSGAFHMFRLSQKKIWFVAKNRPWNDETGSYIYEGGMVWKGPNSPFKKSNWTDYSIVQVDVGKKKDVFLISGGIVDTAQSVKAFIFDSQVLSIFVGVLSLNLPKFKVGLF